MKQLSPEVKRDIRDAIAISFNHYRELGWGEWLVGSDGLRDLRFFGAQRDPVSSYLIPFLH